MLEYKLFYEKPKQVQKSLSQDDAATKKENVFLDEDTIDY